MSLNEFQEIRSEYYSEIEKSTEAKLNGHSGKYSSGFLNGHAEKSNSIK